jgi:hydrogenase maturation protease
MARSILVVGVGQPVRHDDAAGLAAARRLQARADPAARIITCEGDCTTLVDVLRGVDLAIIIDAMCSGRTAGAIHRFDAHDRPLPATFSRASSHAFGVPEAVELTRALGQLPPAVIVFGIEGLDFEMGDGLSPAVDAAVDAVVTQVSDVLTTLA